MRKRKVTPAAAERHQKVEVKPRHGPDSHGSFSFPNLLLPPPLLSEVSGETATICRSEHAEPFSGSARNAAYNGGGNPADERQEPDLDKCASFHTQAPHVVSVSNLAFHWG